MTQNTIIEALQRALTQGSGSLDDLEALMDKAKADIAKAKQEEKEAKEAARKAAEADKLKRGEKIAELATRLLDEEPTEEDVAYVLQVYFKSKGIEAEVTAESIRDGMDVKAELDKNLDELCDALGELFEALVPDKSKKSAAKPTAKSKAKTADDVINDFLRSHGL